MTTVLNRANWELRERDCNADEQMRKRKVGEGEAERDGVGKSNFSDTDRGEGTVDMMRDGGADGQGGAKVGAAGSSWNGAAAAAAAGMKLCGKKKALLRRQADEHKGQGQQRAY